MTPDSPTTTSTTPDTQPDTRKVAVITGASSGIGYATAIAFADKGYNLVLAARREQLLKQVAEQCEQYGVKAVAVMADVSEEEDVQQIADVARTTFGRFDVWVNNAAVALYAKFDEAPMDEYRQVLETNLFGYIYGSQVAIKQFKLQNTGTLINIDSVNAEAPQPYSSAYNISKYGVRGLSHSIRMELELDGLSDNIAVCNVMPASIDTNFFQNAANYTGRKLRALEPVYDPTYVAQHIVKLVDEPQRDIIVGPAGKLMATQHRATPYLYERLMSRFVDRNHLSQEPTPETQGNLYEPLHANTGMRGGWRETRRADKLNAALGLTGAGLVTLAGLSYWYVKRKRSY
ncbi:MAG TPA: SDR family oxidoreductase [Candidatus Limnocylindrales bacterium]|nr:SDR family oxidoreductase [Candidatus Limnocylindrales bacterium]